MGNKIPYGFVPTTTCLYLKLAAIWAEVGDAVRNPNALGLVFAMR